MTIINKFNGGYSLSNYTNSAPVLPWGLSSLSNLDILVYNSENNNEKVIPYPMPIGIRSCPI